MNIFVQNLHFQVILLSFLPSRLQTTYLCSHLPSFQVAISHVSLLTPSFLPGCRTFTADFTGSVLDVYCNGSLIGTRQHMSLQDRNVGRVWFADLEQVKGSYLIEVRGRLFHWVELFWVRDSHGLLCTSGDLPETSPGDLPEK